MSDVIDILGIGVLVVMLIAGLLLLGMVLGGIGGYAVVTLYNGIFGMGFDPMLGALIGSIVAVGSIPGVTTDE